MKKTGEILKSARESSGISLKEVADASKIGLSTLEAIVKGDTSSLPAKSFLRGFVGSYAKHLGLNVNDILDCFSEEMGTTIPKPPVEPAEGQQAATQEDIVKEIKPVKSKSDRPSEVLQTAEQKHPAVKIAIILGCIALLIAIILTKKVVDKYDREAQDVQAISQEVIEESEADMILDETFTEEGETQDTSEPDSQSDVEEEEKTEPIETEKKEPKKETIAQTLPEKTEPAAEANPEEEKPKKEEKKTGPVEVIIEAFDTVKVDYRPDGGDLVSKTLGPEEVLTIRASENVNIDFSDGGAVTVTYNGKDLGVPGNLGEPFKLRLP